MFSQLNLPVHMHVQEQAENLLSKSTTTNLNASLTASLALCAALLVSATSASFAADKKAVIGLWKTHNGQMVRFSNCGRGLCGRLMTSRPGLRKDKNNPNPKLRNRSIKGLTIIRSHKKAGPNKWVGTIYNIKDGKVYNGSLTLTGPRTATMTGCDIGICQSATWRKIGKTRITSLQK